MGINKAYYKGVFFILATFYLFSCKRDNNDPGYEFMPDMYRSPSYETYSENPNFKDELTARQPVKGTIARGFMPYEYPNTNEGYEAAGNELKNPIELTDEILAEGQKLFIDFCSHCHGAEGLGDGSLVQLDKFPPPPPFNGSLKDLPEGKMFHSITYGKNLMGSHSSQLTKEERWKIIHFIQVLQRN